MYSNDETTYNLWVRRALLSAFFSNEEVRLFANQSFVFVHARNHFRSMPAKKLLRLQKKIRTNYNIVPTKRLLHLKTPKIMGLTSQAKAFLKKRRCKNIESDSYTIGNFEDNIPLRKWIARMGKRSIVIREALQCTIWDNGPMLFFCLEAEINGNKMKIHPWNIVCSI